MNGLYIIDIQHIMTAIDLNHQITIKFNKLDQYIPLYLGYGVNMFDTIDITPKFALFLYANRQLWHPMVNDSQHILKMA